MDARVCLTSLAALSVATLLNAETSQPANTAWSRLAGRSAVTLASLAQSGPTPGIRNGDLHLGFNGFFGPVGDRGLDYSPALQSLEGKRVEVTGHMVRDPGRPPGILIMAATPVTIEQTSVCTQVELPTAVIHVILPDGQAGPAFRPGPLTLAGRLEIGPRAEVDGRNSCVRLIVDRDAAASLFPLSLPSRSSP